MELKGADSGFWILPLFYFLNLRGMMKLSYGSCCLSWISCASRWVSLGWTGRLWLVQPWNHPLAVFLQWSTTLGYELVVKKKKKSLFLLMIPVSQGHKEFAQSVWLNLQLSDSIQSIRVTNFYEKWTENPGLWFKKQWKWKLSLF